jgi:purine-binding chemotaxis protein CheW
VEGVTNLRGEVIPVINLRNRFNMISKEADDRTRIIIVDVNGSKTGLRVDSVSQVLNVPNRDVEKPPKAVEEGGAGQFISGIAKVDGGRRMIVFLDVERILNVKAADEAKTGDEADQEKTAPARKSGTKSGGK